MTYLDDLRSKASQQLDYQSQRATGYRRYYDGDPDIIALLETQERQAFRRLLSESRANWGELIVNAVAERMQVVGFRFGGTEASEAAWLLWQANQMDADSQLVQTDALVCGQAFVLVQPDETNPSGVSITAESPHEATVLYQAGNRRRRIAGYKRFRDGVGGPTTEILVTPEVIATWGPGTGEPVTEVNPAGVVSLVEVNPQPRTVGWPLSELSGAIPTIDRIHTLLFNRMVGADYGSFRQIWATGVKMQREVAQTENGEKVTFIRPYDIGADRLLVNENPDAKFGSFPGDGLAGYLGAVEQDVTQLAATTQTPAHYITGTVANLSADAIKAAEVGLVAKIRRRLLFVGESYEEIERIGLGLIGHAAATDVEAEVIWADPETRSEAQRVDALVKMRALGVPLTVLWERWGASPQEIERWQQLADQEAARAVPPPVVPPALLPAPSPEPVT
jgi:hypothetical protein